MTGIFSLGIIAGIKDQLNQKSWKNQHNYRNITGKYEKYIKRPLDVMLAASALIGLSPILGITALLVKFKLGSPVLFIQLRPGQIDPLTGKEKIFKMYKFRSMTDKKDKKGHLLSDEERLTDFGKKLRSTSLDELPELINIIKGDMSIIGPRPQLVYDLVFMDEQQRQRHLVKPGLSGLAQIEGRNAISWEDKFTWDLKYIENISLLGDVKIIFKTIWKVFLRKSPLKTNKEIDLTLDLGEYLLEKKQISSSEYIEKIEKAKEIIYEKTKPE